MTDLLASASGYGGGGYGAGGYGQTLDCNSALGLLAFLGLIDLLRDIVQQITSANTATATATRRRRSLASMSVNESEYFSEPHLNFTSKADLDSEPYSVLEFIQMGGADGLYEELPHIFLPLISSLSESRDGQHPAPCLAAPLCRANAELVHRFGEMGRILGTLLSNVLAKAFTGGRLLLMQEMEEGARQGRLLQPCERFEQQCSTAQLSLNDPLGSPFAWLPLLNSTQSPHTLKSGAQNLQEIR